jgi:hypothetical protein
MAMSPFTTRKNEAERIATVVADRCHGKRKVGEAPQRYATIWQAAFLGALEALGEQHNG